MSEFRGTLQKKVSKSEWDTLTEKYFSIGSDKIKWLPYEDFKESS
jgi:hypothetical protein